MAGSSMIKKAQKTTTEPVKDATTVGAERVVTSTSAPTIEIEDEPEPVIRIRTPTSSQPTPTTPIQPISPQPRPQSIPRSRSTPRQQPGSSNNIFDDDLPFLNFDTMNLGFLDDPNGIGKQSEAVQMEAVIASLVSENERLRKRLRDLEADKKVKDRKIDVLYKVLEKKLGINIEEGFNQILIEEAEARARKAVVGSEAANANKGKEKVDAISEIRPKPESEPESETVDITQFVLIGEAYDVSYETEKE
ncbi:hypothetical protein Hanom_Chr11g00981601 [Helianthus anomalus]